MSMILYHGEPNGPSLAVLAALFESGVSAETHAIDLVSGARHALSNLSEVVARDMSVEGEGPVLVVNGEAMTESVFIAQFLDEIGAGTLQPKDAYAHWQMLMWCRRITERCAPAAAYLGCHAHAFVTAVPEGIFSDDLKARWEMVADKDYSESALNDSRSKVADAANLVEEQLADGRDWLMERFSIADLETYGWLAGMAEIVPSVFDSKARLQSWLIRVASRPSVVRALALATMPDPRKAWAPGPEINRWG
jgi:glutathione S-transferase